MRPSATNLTAFKTILLIFRLSSYKYSKETSKTEFFFSFVVSGSLTDTVSLYPSPYYPPSKEF